MIHDTLMSLEKEAVSGILQLGRCEVPCWQ